MSYSRLHPGFSLTEERLAELQAVVPEAFADGKVNWDTLRDALDPFLEDEGLDAEHYGLFWPGKREARRLVALPSRGALHPALGEGVNEDTTRNVFIEGDNLEVLKLLLKSYAGRVKMIYIDPPYNTGNDFVYKDDYSEPLESYLRRTGQVDATGALLTSNSASGGRFHSNWLNMMYPRLMLARMLLREDGLMFVSIDDHEYQHLRACMDEVFGEECFVATLIWKRRQIVDSRAKTGVSVDHEYLVVFARSSDARLRGQEKDLEKYSNPDNDPRGPWASNMLIGLATRDQRPNLHYDLINPATGDVYPCPETGWRYSKSTMARLIADGRILWPAKASGRPRLKRYLNELADEFTGLSSILNTVYSTQGTRELRELFDGRDMIDFPKPTEYIKLILEQATNPDEDDVVVDFFAGSSTTAQAVLELNRKDGGSRRFILVQLPELTPEESQARRAGYITIADLGKERIRRVIQRMQAENTSLLLDNRETPQDLGFRIFKLTRSDVRAWQDYDGMDVSKVEDLFSQAETPLVDGWSRQDLLTEVILLEGFPLDSAMMRDEPIQSNAVTRVTSDARGHALYVCFDERIADETARRLRLGRDDVFVCLDTALSDESKMRLADVCTLHTI